MSEEYLNSVKLVLFAHWNAAFLQQLPFVIYMQLAETERLFLPIKREIKNEISDLKI